MVLFLLMFIGLCLVFKPLSVVADVLPIFGDLVGLGTGVVSFGIAATCSLLTIAFAWIFYRPLVGVPLLVLGLGLFVALIVKSKQAKAARGAS